jgi:hypothetical protein
MCRETCGGRTWSPPTSGKIDDRPPSGDLVRLNREIGRLVDKARILMRFDEPEENIASLSRILRTAAQEPGIACPITITLTSGSDANPKIRATRPSPARP